MTRAARTGGLLCVAALLGSLAPFTWAAEPEPEEYREDEFAPWVHDLRRAEIVAFGSLPFSMFLVTLGYDSVRYAVHFEEPEARRYAPWPFRSANPAPYTTEETIGMVVGVIACSVAVSVADFLIGRILERRAQAR